MEKTLVIFGGAFNPVTCAHLFMAEQALMLDWVKQVLFLPVGDYYYKHELVQARHRVAMLKRVCASNPRFGVSALEAASGYSLHTYDTLKIIARQHPTRRVAFLMGSDNLKDIPVWYRCNDLLTEFAFIVAPRGGDQPEQIIEATPLLNRYRDRFTIIDWISSISSTLVRQTLESGGSINCLIPEEVVRYIRDYHLFGARDFQSISDFTAKEVK